MKTFNHTFHWLATMLVAIATLAAACSEDIETMTHQQPDSLAGDTATHVYQLHFDCRQPSFDTLTTRAATSWPDGATVYLQFAGNYTYDAYYGQAVYSSSTGKWTLSVTGSVPLTETSTRSCKAYYFVNPVTVSSSSVTLNEQTAVYEATGTYTHPTSSEFYVTMTLKPATWRLSFKGTNNSTAFTLPFGAANTISWPSSYNRSTGELSWTSLRPVSLTTNRSYYSPYVYGKFTNSSTNTITVSYNTGEAYQRTFDASRLAIGESGYFTLPTSSNYSSLGWSLAAGEQYLSPSSWTSTNKADNSTGDIEWTITANVGDVLSFDYSVSSEAGYDKLNVRLSGALSYTLVDGASGSISNRTVTYTFTKTGTYTLRAAYTKDQSNSIGDDCATINNLKIKRGGVIDASKLDFTVTGNGKTITFTMVYVAPGTFQMGSTTSTSDAKPVHSVTLTDAYYIGETEVTQGLWYAVTGLRPTSGGSSWRSTYKTGDTRPAYYISYYDCLTFINSLNSELSAQLGGLKFRMPTEAEWEFAARGGNSSRGYTYAGSNTIGNVAWYYDNSGKYSTSSSYYGVQVVKTKSANELGIYDMSGNVMEWCSDWYGSYSSEAQTNPTGPSTGSDRVLRGGSWYNDATYCPAAARARNEPSYRYNYYGLRLVLQ